MKKAIELLEEIKMNMELLQADSGFQKDVVSEIKKQADEAIAILKAHRWETPEQWEERTGQAWPDNGAVYARQKEHGKWSGWVVVRLNYARLGTEGIEHTIICATEAGPPPDGWKPEGGKERNDT